MIVQSASADKQSTDITFSLGALDLDKAVDCLEAFKNKLGYQALVADPDMAKVSVIGSNALATWNCENYVFCSG